MFFNSDFFFLEHKLEVLMQMLLRCCRTPTRAATIGDDEKINRKKSFSFLHFCVIFIFPAAAAASGSQHIAAAAAMEKSHSVATEWNFEKRNFLLLLFWCSFDDYCEYKYKENLLQTCTAALMRARASLFFDLSINFSSKIANYRTLKWNKWHKEWNCFIYRCRISGDDFCHLFVPSRAPKPPAGTTRNKVRLCHP